MSQMNLIFFKSNLSQKKQIGGNRLQLCGITIGRPLFNSIAFGTIRLRAN